jgi:hypothetical protein
MSKLQDEARTPEQGTGGNQASCCGVPPAGGDFVEIRVKGHLDRQWSDWLGGLEPSLLDNGEMVLSGHIIDQAALIGILNKLNGLNLTILAVLAVDQHGCSVDSANQEL